MSKTIDVSPKTATLPRLTPLKSNWMNKITNDKLLVSELLEKYDSPINIHHIPSFTKNKELYTSVFEEFNIAHKIMFARKANKCKALVQAAKKDGFGVDTASYQELKDCLEIGIPKENLVVTAAIKNEALLSLAVENDVLIVVDNEDECIAIQEIGRKLKKVAKIGIRVSGFYFQEEKLYSRFGFDIDRALDWIISRFGKHSPYTQLDYYGLHFHLNGYSTEQRGMALLACLNLAQQLQAFDLQTRFIDMGGGLLMNYLSEEKQWKHFEEELIKSVRGDRSPITFQNNGLGYEMVNGNLEGRMRVYPYFNRNAKEDFLRKVLLFKNEADQSAGDIARTNNIELRIEPGRSMLDQVGITVARVAFRKQDANGEWLVGLEMNMTQMHSSSADFLLDPKVIYQNDDQLNPKPVAVYFTGAYCLERDVLLKRKISLKKLPEVGDSVVFYNTAGYMMHFFESEAHLFKLARNIILDRDAEDLNLNSFSEDKC